MTDAYVIWSFEHDAWWRPGRMGYTPELDAAGRYTKAEAEEIVADANRYSGSRHPHEAALPLSAALLSGRPAGLHQIAPGVYDDGQGAMHLDLPELLRANGYTDTPENRETLIEAAREMMGSAKVSVIE